MSTAISGYFCQKVSLMKFHSKDPKACFADRYEVRCGKGFEGVVKSRVFFITVKF